MAELPAGGRLGIDWGKARIGVAAAAAGSSFAYPVTTISAGAQEFDELLAVVDEYQPAVIYLGLPLTLQGQPGIAAEYVSAKAAVLAERLTDQILRLVDERLSTASASRNLRGAGRSSKQQRSVIDQAAAVEILQRAVDQEAATGGLAGRAVNLEEE